MFTNQETPGTRGYTKSTWRKEHSWRAVLLRSVKDNPDLDKEELGQLMVAAVEDEVVRMVLQVLKEHPDASDTKLVEEYVTRSRSVATLLREAALRYFDNDLNEIQGRPRRRAPQQPSAPEQPSASAAPEQPSTEQPQAEATEQPSAPEQPRAVQPSAAREPIVVSGWAARIAYLNLTMPNGKALRDCTKAECRQLGGVWKASLDAVADKLVNDDDVVGDKLNEAEVASAFGGQQQ
jgi:hypothetical protein